ncbi:MAG: hypothetical protein ACKPGI_02980 [Verrucomicrobiota bacterium]
MDLIPNETLRPEDIPGPGAEWPDLAAFALTFDGYGVWDSFERCAEIANERRGETLTELRTCLFFEQRRWRHFGEDPDEETMDYLRKVVDRIRQRVVSGNIV